MKPTIENEQEGQSQITLTSENLRDSFMSNRYNTLTFHHKTYKRRNGSGEFVVRCSVCFRRNACGLANVDDVLLKLASAQGYTRANRVRQRQIDNFILSSQCQIYGIGKEFAGAYLNILVAELDKSYLVFQVCLVSLFDWMRILY